MLSIIISSYQRERYNNLIKNINDTIGDDFLYEVIQILNPNLMGITEAYNKGAKKAIYNHLLFVHEDILFHTSNWGQKLIQHFENPSIGIVGVAGSSYVPQSPCGWYINDSNYNHIHYIQNNKINNPTLIDTFSEGEIKKRTFALDGVFLAIKKYIYLDILFNENLKGFHGYDLDFSLRVAQSHENYVINNILIEHFSQGNPDKEWFESTIEIKRNVKYKYNQEINSKIERNLFLEFLAKYFSYYFISRKTLFETFKFFPGKIGLKDRLLILKAYFYYVRFSKSYNKKYRNA